VREHERVVVHVDDAAFARHPLGDLVGVVGGGQSGADVQELADARLADEVPDRAAEERPVGARNVDDAGEELHVLVTGFSVDGEVVFAAQPAVACSSGTEDPPSEAGLAHQETTLNQGP
jgi:hypothetical protein